MRRPLLLAFAAALAGSCRTATPSTSVATDPAMAATSVVVPQGGRLDTARWVDSTLASLPLRRRVAQMVMFWMLGDYTSVDDSTFAEVVNWVQREGVGGISMSLGTPIEVAACARGCFVSGDRAWSLLPSPGT